MVDRGCACFCCPRWYCEGIVSDDKLGFVVVSLEAALICIFNFGKCMKPCVCVVSKSTLLFLKKVNPIIGPVILLITAKCSAKIMSPILYLGGAVVNGLFNWPFVTCIWNLGGSSILGFSGGFLFYCVQFTLGNCTDVAYWAYQGIYS